MRIEEYNLSIILHNILQYRIQVQLTGLVDQERNILFRQQQKGYKKFSQHYLIWCQVMNEQFELKLLLRQNSQMVSRIQIYRRQNQLLVQKNQDLNLWVQNLSQVFAAIGAAWKSITGNQEAMFTLMKKRSDANSKSLISKYVSHFRTFDDIITLLGEKITNSGHSKDVTLDAKTRLTAFVQNYQIFFKQLVDAYFKFNDEYLQWITQLKSNPQMSQNFRIIANKEIQNKIKIKEFEQFMTDSRGKFKSYEVENQHTLLDGLLEIKNQEINSLKSLNQTQSRRIQLINSYLASNAQEIIDHEDQKQYECFCGGKQLEYCKKQWEKHLEELRSMSCKSKLPTSQQNGSQSSVFQSQQSTKQDLELLQFEKQKLFDRISSLNTKIQKMRTQSRLSEQLVLGSSAYSILHSQAGQLLSFIDQLLNKINAHYGQLYEIEKAREEEMLELRGRLIVQLKQQLRQQQSLLQSSSESPTAGKSPALPTITTNLIQFKTTISQSIKQLLTQYSEINSTVDTKQQSLTQSRQLISQLQKEIHDLTKKVQHLQASLKQPSIMVLEFRHQKFTQIEKKITSMLEFTDNSFNNLKPEKQHLLKLWQQFIGYVKSRDKKVRDLQTVIKKKQKQILTKDKLVSVLQSSLRQTQSVYMTAQGQVKKFTEFITSTQKQLHTLAEKNLSLRAQYQQQKLSLSCKSKLQAQLRLKLQQRVKSFQSIQQQMTQLKRISHQTQQSYQQWISEQQSKLMSIELARQQAEINFSLKKAQCEQKQKTIKKLNEQKQKWRSQCNRLGAKFNAIENKSQLGVIKMQMQEYKRKLMCSCQREQQRTIVLKTCPHVFCRRCIEGMNISRNRKCPSCGIKFGKSDLHQIKLS